jgi:two-component system, NtrC family, sensor histidine kinase HydH
VPVLILITLIAFTILYNKNQDYKRKLNEQTHLAQLGQASRTLAHEIKNPLQAIKIQIELLKNSMPVKYKSELDIIAEETERIKIITDKIREFLQNPAGIPENVDISTFIKNLIVKYNQKIIFTDLTNGEENIFIDPGKLRSILENVITNAIESYEDKDVKAIEVELKKENKLTITITDNGKGLAPDYKDKIFTPYYSTKANGSGIGLSIASRFTEAAKGKIAIMPRPTGGTMVILTFKTGVKN